MLEVLKLVERLVLEVDVERLVELDVELVEVEREVL